MRLGNSATGVWGRGGFHVIAPASLVSVPGVPVRTLPADSRVNLSVYDIAGRRVATLVDGIQPGGGHEAAWNGRTDGGARSAPGIYFLRQKDLAPAPNADTDAVVATREFGLGFALVAGNFSIPVNWLALITVVFSLGLDPFSGPPGFFSLGVALGIMGWFTLLVVLLSRFRHRFADHTLSRIMRAMGALLIVTGIVALIRSGM